MQVDWDYLSKIELFCSSFELLFRSGLYLNLQNAYAQCLFTKKGGDMHAAPHTTVCMGQLN